MTEHERQADRLERELDEMAEQSERLEGEIDATRADWERKKRDSNVPGAAGEPEEAE
jgi:phage shock protein A